MRNVSSNWVGFAVNALVTLLLTPFVLRELGEARYGVWILTSSVIGYYGFLDLGFRGGVTQYLTRYLAVRDHRRANECLSSAVVAFSLFGAFLVFLSMGAAHVAPHVFNFPRELESESFWCILIVGLSSAIQFTFFPFAAVFPATQRFDLANLIGIGTRLLTAGGIFVALIKDYGLIGVSLATCGASLVDYLIRWRVALRLVPGLKISWRLARLDRLREIASFGAWNFLISVNTYAYEHMPAILIGAFMPIAAVGHYALATGLLRSVNSVLSPVGRVLYPAAVELHAMGDSDGLQRLYHKGSRLLILVMIPVVLTAMFWAEDFYRLWIGEKYLGGTDFHSVALLLQILLISTITGHTSNIAAQVLSGSGYIRVLSIVLMGGSIINLTISLILIHYYGLAGVAASTAIASIIVNFFIIPMLAQKLVSLSIKDFFCSACVRPVAVAVLLVVLMTCIRLAGKPSSWFDLIFQGVGAVMGSIVVVLGVGVTTDERHRFLVHPLARLRDKVRAGLEATGY